MHKDNIQKQLGFTLIESMMGMFVLGIFMMSLLAAVPHMAILAKKSEVARNANSVANNKIEFFRTVPFDTLFDDVLGKSPIKEFVEINDVEYRVVTEVKKFEIGGVDTQAVSVEVRVEWDVLNQKSQNTTTWTIFTKNGLSDKQFIQAS